MHTFWEFYLKILVKVQLTFKYKSMCILAKLEAPEIWTSIHLDGTRNAIVCLFLYIMVWTIGILFNLVIFFQVFVARPHNRSHRIHSCLPCHDEGNCLSYKIKKCRKTRNFMYKTYMYGELSTNCHHFDYRPLVVARFQKAVNFLNQSGWFHSNFHWFISIINTI